MIHINVGTNFKIEQIHHFIDLNKKYKNVKITSVYGSLWEHFFRLPSARPNYRLANVQINELKEYIAIAHENGIKIEYAINAPLNKSIKELNDNIKDIITNLKYLEEIGIDIVIIANPLLMEIVSNYTNLKIKISTIMEINNPLVIRHFAKFNIKYICPSIYVNRNLPLLTSMNNECSKFGIELVLLSNEICMYGDVPCNTFLRSSCFYSSSVGGNEIKSFNNWPFERCQTARLENPICWLKIPYILPQHMKIYEEKTGITNFKVSGRTNTINYLYNILENYMTEEFEGDITQLFMLPQNVYNNNDKRYSIKKLTELKHFDKWLIEDFCDYNCWRCRHCETIYKEL